MNERLPTSTVVTDSDAKLQAVWAKGEEGRVGSGRQIGFWSWSEARKLGILSFRIPLSITRAPAQGFKLKSSLRHYIYVRLYNLFDKGHNNTSCYDTPRVHLARDSIIKPKQTIDRTKGLPETCINPNGLRSLHPRSKKYACYTH